MLDDNSSTSQNRRSSASKLNETLQWTLMIEAKVADPDDGTETKREFPRVYYNDSRVSVCITGIDNDVVSCRSSTTFITVSCKTESVHSITV